MAVAWAALTWHSRVLWIGDSVTGPFSNASSPAIPITQAMRALFGPVTMPAVASPFLPPIYKWPTCGDVSGVAGRECFTIGQTAPTFAAFAANVLGPFTHAVIQLGINDAANITGATRTAPQVLAAHLVILNGLRSIFDIPYRAMLTIGPWQRPADLSASVPLVDTQFQTNSDLLGAAFVKWSGISSAGGLSIGDQTHPSVSGAALLAVPVIAAMSAAS